MTDLYCCIDRNQVGCGSRGTGDVTEVLEEFSGVFPLELPKKIPPRMAIDHDIELELGARPSTQATYRICPAELVELSKPLNGLFEAGLIQPSEALYGGRAFVSTGTLRRRLLRETHDPQWAGHLGIERMLASLSRQYYWPKMEEDVEAYVSTCLVCQLDKVEKKETGLYVTMCINHR
ncbi:hypothetical protein Salat_1129800 [Sesamum alatum]|uniref:Integrase zinc-binding domain-containing protein n=1 Tax=Sesamum alatum TaxID=300844 RepID=A0AAE1YDU1_9LAMI|nr:hypothetical protein Salat_1129800 [Sesamum alatum]